MKRITLGLAAAAVVVASRLNAQCLIVEDTLFRSTALDGELFPMRAVVSGDYIYASAFSNGGVNQGGRVFVFRRQGFDWTEVGVMTPQNGDIDGRFGAALVREGGWLAIGQPLKDGAGFDEGRLELYSGSDGAWTHHSTVSSSTISSGDHFGTSAAMSGSRLVVGAPSDAPRGAAFVYEWNELAWVEVARLAPSGPGGPERFGNACAMEGNWIAIGSPLANAVYVFRLVDDVWVQQSRLTPSDASGQMAFGDVLAMQNNTLLVGAPLFKPINGSVPAGKAYVFVRQSGFWYEQAHINPPGGSTGEFGASIAFQGDAALVAASSRNYAQLIRRSGTLWTGETVFGQPTQNAPNRASAVAIDGDTLFVGLRQNLGVEAALTYRFDSGTATYCTAKTNSLGCTPQISISGSASTSSTSACTIAAHDVLAQRPGMLFYSTTSAALVPFLGGTLCLATPLKRTAVQFAGGSSGCDGSYSFDFNAHLALGVDPALVPGARFWAQFWSRDPGFAPPDNVGLTDAVSAFVCP